MLTVRLALQLHCKCGTGSMVMHCNKKDRNAAERALRQDMMKHGWDVTPLKERCQNCVQRGTTRQPAAGSAPAPG